MDDVKKEFGLAQARLSELVSEHRRLCETITRKDHEHRVALLTLKELSSLPETTTVHRTLGKAFVKSEMSHVQDRLKSVGISAAADKEKLLKRKPQLEESIEAADAKAKSLYEELQKS